MKNIKKIIGIIGNEEDRNIVTNILLNKGYYKISIIDKVKEIAKLLKLEDNLDLVRERGYKVGRLYWINLLLPSVPNDKNLILIDDLRLEDIVEKIMKVYYVSNKNIVMPDTVEKIERPENIDDFKKIVEKILTH